MNPEELINAIYTHIYEANTQVEMVAIMATGNELIEAGCASAIGAAKGIMDYLVKLAASEGLSIGN